MWIRLRQLMTSPLLLSAWNFEGQSQLSILRETISCPHPAGNCASSLHSLQHMPLDVKAQLQSREKTCFREHARSDLRLEVSVDARCLPGLPSNVSCYSVSEMYPRATEWPFGYGVFNPLRECAGADPDLLAAVCTLRCAVAASGNRHLELFCSYELDRKGRYRMRERHVHIDFCDMASTCVSETLEESELVCYEGQVSPKSAGITWLLRAMDTTILVPVATLVAICGFCYTASIAVVHHARDMVRTQSEDT